MKLLKQPVLENLGEVVARPPAPTYFPTTSLKNTYSCNALDTIPSLSHLKAEIAN